MPDKQIDKAQEILVNTLEHIQNGVVVIGEKAVKTEIIANIGKRKLPFENK